MSVQKEHRDRVTRYYDVAGPFYQRFWHRESLGIHYGIWDKTVTNRQEAILRENQVLADKAQIKSGSLVLDAGCGIGGSGIWLARERGARVIGLNITQAQLHRAHILAREKRLEDSLDFARGDYQQLPFKVSSFDVFWSLEGIEHATNPQALVREAYRILKPGGRIVIAAMFKGKEMLKHSEERQLDVFRQAAGCFPSFKTAEQVEDFMVEAGFVYTANENRTDQVMESAKQIAKMCRWGLPIARILADFKRVSPIVLLNNKWGTYQEGLFKSNALTYNILSASKT